MYAIRKILKTNKRLKSLAVQYSLVSEVFSSNIEFKLKELRVSWDSLKIVHAIKKFNVFLKTQRENIEILRLEKWMRFEVLNTILLMPRLQKLNLSDHNFKLSENTPAWLPNSQSVTSLDVSGIDGFSFYKKLLQSFPNVENLIISEINSELSFLIRDKFKSLKKLTVYDFSTTNLSLRAFKNVEVLEIGELTNKSADFISRAFKCLQKLKIHCFQATKIPNKDFYLNLEEFSCDEVDRSSVKLFQTFGDKNVDKDWKIVSVEHSCHQDGKVWKYLLVIAVLCYHYFFYFEEFEKYLDELEFITKRAMKEYYEVDSDVNSTITEDTFIDEQTSATDILLHTLFHAAIVYFLYRWSKFWIGIIFYFNSKYSCWREYISEFSWKFRPFTRHRAANCKELVFYDNV